MFFTILVAILLGICDTLEATFIVLGFLFGLSMIGQVLEPWLEKLFVFILVWGPNQLNEVFS